MYIPKELLRDGFSGNVDIFTTPITLTIIHPNADLRKIEKGLEITSKDIELRLKSYNSNIDHTGDKVQKKNSSKRKGSSD